MERMTHTGNNRTEPMTAAGEEEDAQGAQSAQGLLPVFDLENPVDWLDSSLPISFGQMGETGQARDLWDLIDMDTLLAGNHDYSI